MAKNKLILHHHPIGTPAEIKAIGSKKMTLANCAACCLGGKGVKDEHGGNVRGCAVYKDCRFDDPNFMPDGAEDQVFKGSGPKTIGYYRSTDEGAKEDHMSCYTFVRTLQHLYDAQERTGEVIAVVAVEPPREMVEKVRKGELSLDEVPDYHKITVLKRLSVAGPLANRNNDIRVTEKNVERLVPNFPRPSERFAKEQYEAKIAANRSRQRTQRMKRRVERMTPDTDETILPGIEGGFADDGSETATGARAGKKSRTA